MKLFKLTVTFGLITLLSSQIQANPDAQCVQRIIIAVKKTVQRKQKPTCTETRYVPAEILAKVYRISEANIDEKTTKLIKDDILRNPANKEFIIEALVGLFCDPRNHDSLDQHINLFDYVHRHGARLPAYNKPMLELQKIKRCRDLSTLRRTLEGFIGSTSAQIKNNIEHMILDEKLVIKTKWFPDYSPFLRVLNLRLMNQ